MFGLDAFNNWTQEAYVSTYIVLQILRGRGPVMTSHTSLFLKSGMEILTFLPTIKFKTFNEFLQNCFI